jgi:Phosphopantetheine attachment site
MMQAGLDSLAAVELRNGIAAAFDVQPPVTLTYDYPTLAALAAFLAPQPAATSASYISSIQVGLDDTACLCFWTAR